MGDSAFLVRDRRKMTAFRASRKHGAAMPQLIPNPAQKLGAIGA